MIRIKICGITHIEDALAAIEQGADALGFVFYPKSPRFVTAEKAAEIISGLPPFVATVGVFVDETPEEMNRIAEACRLDLLQLHGSEPAEIVSRLNRRVIRGVRVSGSESLTPVLDYPASALLLDAYVAGEAGGTGRTFDWEIARKAAASRRVILSGGLNPDNVAEAVRRVRPYGVDVSSGVEMTGDKRRKDPEKIRKFIAQARLDREPV